MVMRSLGNGDKVGLHVKALKVVKTILEENPEIREIFENSETPLEARMNLREWIMKYLQLHPNSMDYYLQKATGHSALKRISYRDYAAIRLMDYLDNEGRIFNDPNRNNTETISQPIKHLFQAIKYGKGSASIDFFVDMLFLFRQLNGKLTRKKPDTSRVVTWMDHHPSGLDEDIIVMRSRNKERIIRIMIEKISTGAMKSATFKFEDGLTEEEKYQKILTWWDDHRFHLVFAIRDPDLLNELLDFSLREKTMKTLKKAKKKGIPIFVNPYYLSLVSVDISPVKTGGDQPIRDYIFPNKELIAEFGNIHAWEKEDDVQPGEPNAAGWILPPYHNVHRRYPEVAIFIPDTAGRACGGLCVSCQRMYDFQSGRFNFNLDRLVPRMSWPEKMKKLLEYWEKDTQLRDILITGGDALMNTDNSLRQILEEVYQMALRKKNANNYRPTGQRFAELIRVRLGTRLPVYLPQRITPELVSILADFKKKAAAIGVKQFVIQTHIQTAMEVTPELKKAVNLLISAGWIVSNQMVFTTASSRRGHTAKLRKVLNDIGVIPYYTFSVKGFMENYHNFATNERAAQERVEEKYIGNVSPKEIQPLVDVKSSSDMLVDKLHEIRKQKNIPFISTDRSVMNLPGVGKSLTFRTIGITDDGRRILEFSHDITRNHSPIIHTMGNVIIVESKSINAYLKQMEDIGEDRDNYKTLWGYSSSETEVRMPIFKYPDYDFATTDELTNFRLEVPEALEEAFIHAD